MNGFQHGWAYDDAVKSGFADLADVDVPTTAKQRMRTKYA
jgi:hypothetical protein